MAKFTLEEIAKDQATLIKKLEEQPCTDASQNTLDLLGIVVKLTHVLADLNSKK